MQTTGALGRARPKVYYARRITHPARPGAVPDSIKPTLAAAVAALALLFGAAPVHADEAANAQSRLQRLGSELGRALGALRERVVARDSLRQRLAEADRRVARVNAEIALTESTTATLRQQLDALRAEQTAARERIDAQRQMLARSLVLAARSGNADRLVLLLRQEDPARLARLLRYQRHVADAQAARLGELHRQLDAFEQREAQIAEEAAAVAVRQGELDRQRQELARARAERQALLAKAEQDVDRGERAVRAIEQDQRELKSLLARIAQREAAARQREEDERRRAKQADASQAQAKAGPPSTRTPAGKAQPAPLGPSVSATPTPSLPGERFSARRSRLPWPVSGQLKARFGTRRESGRTRWDGVVIAARPGSPVRSIHAGKVVYADVLGGYGLLVIVDHGEGYLSLYGYNDAVLKRVGQRVQGGEPIASVGDRGSASGAYFEIRHRGQPVNPSVWCGG